MKKTFLGAAIALAVAVPLLAQSPRGSAAATVGGKQVSIDYGRPQLKGRPFDELLKQLPADRMWRAGSEQVTTLKTESDLLIGGKKLPAGKYSLYVHVAESGDYALAINSDLGVPLGQIWDKAPDNLKQEPWPHMDDYGKAIGAKEVARVTLKQAALKAPVDQFTIDLTPASLTLAWGDKSFTADVAAAK